MQVWVHEGVIGDRLAAVLRHVDIARRMLQAWSDEIPMPRAQSHHHPSRFDFSAVGDWFVVHSGAGQVVATATTVAATVPEIPTAVAAQSVGLARPAELGGGQ